MGDLDRLFNSRGKGLRAHAAAKASPLCACGKRAWYRAGTKTYCPDHKDLAVRHMKKISYQQAYRARRLGLQREYD